MPSRLKRYQDQGSYHFLTFSCYRRLPFLNNDGARAGFLETLEAVRAKHEFCVFGYVLMPEHVHMLVSEPKNQRLDARMRVMKGKSSRLLRGTRERFWQALCYDFNLLTHAKSVEKLRYIHRNPVARGLVSKPEDWEWSSFRHWATGEVGTVEVESHWTWDRRERGGREHIPLIAMKPR